MDNKNKTKLKKELEDLVYIYQDGTMQTGFDTVDILADVTQDMLKHLYTTAHEARVASVINN